MPNEPFKRVFRHTGTIPTHERPNLVADRQLLQIMQLDREGDSEGVARMLETTPDLDEPAAEPDDDPEPMSAPASSSGQMIMQEPFYAAGVAPPRVADRAEPTAVDLQAAAGMGPVPSPAPAPAPAPAAPAQDQPLFDPQIFRDYGRQRYGYDTPAPATLAPLTPLTLSLIHI